MAPLNGINGAPFNNQDPRLIELGKKLWNEYIQICDQKEMYRFQMSRTKWLSMGDRNTHYFHQSFLTKWRKNRIDALQDDNQI